MLSEYLKHGPSHSNNNTNKKVKKSDTDVKKPMSAFFRFSQ